MCHEFMHIPSFKKDTNLVVQGSKIVPRIAQHSVGEDNILSETKQTQVNPSELSSSELKLDQLNPSKCLRT